MSASWLCLMAIAGSGMAAVAGGPADDLSGVWILNVEKSSWARMRAPASVYVRIEQAHNTICYDGLVTYTNEDSRQFSFEGAIDGREYPAVRSYGHGKLMFRRLNAATVETVFTSADGRFVETSRTVLAPEGRRMTRYMRVRSPDGNRSWIEIYDRKID